MKMKTKQFCCDENRSYYEQYYANQCGNGMNVFQGARGQRGHGLGSMLSGLVRSALPMIKNFGRNALQTGLNVATDVVEGTNFQRFSQKTSSGWYKRLSSRPIWSVWFRQAKKTDAT